MKFLLMINDLFENILGQNHVLKTVLFSESLFEIVSWHFS